MRSNTQVFDRRRLIVELSIGERFSCPDPWKPTVVAFTNLKLNPGLSDRQFQFTPPAGVTVVTPPAR
jgi:hypothetical protein